MQPQSASEKYAASGARPKLYQNATQNKFQSTSSDKMSQNSARPFPRKDGSNFGFDSRPPVTDEKKYDGSRGRQRGPSTPCFVGYKKLQQWADCDNSSILVLDISNNLGGLCTLLQKTEIRHDWMAFLIAILKNILYSPSQSSSKYYILKSVCESRFFDVHLKKFVNSIGERVTSGHAYGYFSKLLDIIDFVLQFLPEYKTKCNRLLQLMLDAGKQLNVLRERETLTLRAEKFFQLSAIAVEPQYLVPQSKLSKLLPYPDEAQPPDDYRELRLFPDTDELECTAEPFLRANKTSGPYRDLRHYLDVHARLLKEDYLEPVRLGLQEYKSNHALGKVKENDLRFYYDVQLVDMGYNSNEGITHYVSFRRFEGKDEDFNWEQSKRLLFGSLLCFSKDDFQTTIFATVAGRDRVAQGILEVIFQNNLEEVFTSSEQDAYVIGETTAYFMSYRHVLEGLQEMNQLPLERYILFCSQDVDPPEYFLPDQQYDLGCLFPAPHREFLVSPLQIRRLLTFADDSELNESQLEALEIALTREMAVIQGPPGTGKTFVGLKIMNVLLASQKLSESLESKGPILVVCYTNHALDQFLEGVLDFCPSGIVRIGGRSHSETLAEFNLKELRGKTEINKSTKGHVGRLLRSCSEKLKKISRLLKRSWQELLRTETTILTGTDLQEEMSSVHFESLNNPQRLTESNTHALSQWLKAASANMENHLRKVAKRHLAKAIASQKCPVPADDSKLISKKIALKTGVLDRFKIYHGWLAKYKQALEAENMEHEENSDQFYSLLDNFGEASSGILPDNVLIKYMSNEGVLESIKACVKAENNVIEDDERIVQQWMLGVLKRTDQLLDAIESLNPVKTSDTNKISEDEESHAQSRWTIGDSDDSDDDDDDADEINLYTTGLEDIDEGGNLERLKFKELEQLFKESESRDILLLQRAKMLGMDVTEHPDEEENEWKMTNTMSYSKVFQLYQGATDISEVEVSQITDVWNMPLPDRYSLYKYWVNFKRQKLLGSILAMTKEYNMLLQRKREAKILKDVEILRKARVIGMTTTGAAKNRKVLQEVGCPIIVIEEAAEVLEAHVVTTLNEKCEHLILIGDHQQLRPNPTVHRLAVRFNLEVSLFERMVKNEVPHVLLDEQHRMRPEISSFMRYIYPGLSDHESVLCYDSIEGIKSNIFFIHHADEEREVEDTHSKANQHEAEFLTALCDYILKHGYLASQITILAAYGGQVQLIRDTMELTLGISSDVYVTSIDNYQGEENDIILLSLVRSNRESKVGFLKISNRVCVALSRAKKGLYAIGNFASLKSSSDLWRNIMSEAELKGMTGPFLPLYCVNHKQHITYVTTAGDFEKDVPEGGCNRKCEFELPCGHVCDRMCHASDRYHSGTLCFQPCRRTCPQGHLCEKNCNEDCGNCEFRVLKTIPLCGHDDYVPCHMDVETAVCSRSCDIQLECGHPCRGSCGQCFIDGHLPCNEKVEKEWPCKHKSIAECHIDVLEDPCPAKCGEKLICGHRCKGTCGGCLGGRVHRACDSECKKLLLCGHPCKGKCGMKCPPCSSRCLNSCRHGGCSKVTCGELCDPCMENCFLSCKHEPCDKHCHEECKKKTPCNKLCKKLVPNCQHRCASWCGEECVCRLCEKDMFYLLDTSSRRKPKYEVAHHRKEMAAKIIQEDGVVLMKVPRCNHVFTSRQLDHHVENFDPTGTSFIRCPVCRTTLHGIWRYDARNKARTERRENLKKALIDSMKISNDKIRKMWQSKALVEDFCKVDEGEFLSSKPEQIDVNHAHTLTLQIRAAYVLQRIIKFHESFNSSKVVHFGKWKTAIRAISNMTGQLKSELELELWRLLFIEQLLALKMFVQEMEVSVPDDLKSQNKNLIISFGKTKLNREGKIKFQATVKEMFSLLEKAPAYKGYRQYIEQAKDEVCIVEKVLNSPDLEDLSTIVARKDSS
ncbi:NFX1-type zinc finger-containing protein 1 [Aplysia californica]|uniref:NFX1-type zinc finger-containing protein 1 n=1 Tax=Aplysia californica TaxID=6500 RepID=A0ABM0K7T6_APLCA|nr:NFX1-type zinc finger-containing protein 1 [Aplysia californica]XP_035828884.1 NFX1-type zinc finger-containing protein 1 [Aplysia californica]XP_035828885.1 NFX1-type zinc finger-containing protein 1 [Aplysia californica]